MKIAFLDTWAFNERMPVFRTSLLIAWRRLVKHRQYTLLNIAGLALGLACSTIIILYVYQELSYDTFHPAADRTFRMGSHSIKWIGEHYYSRTPAWMAPQLKEKYPQLENVARIIPPFENADHVLVERGDNRFFEKRVYFVDPELLDMFHIPLAHGQANLQDPWKILITQSMAEKYFGDADPIGKPLVLELDYDYWAPVEKREFTVEGVLEDSPKNSHWHYDILVSMATMRSVLPTFESTLDDYHFKYTYITLPSDLTTSDFIKQLEPFRQKELDKYTQRSGREMELFEYILTPVTDLHLHSPCQYELEPVGDARYLYIYGGIALLTLLIGCLNYITLSAALAAMRVKEVGFRKIIGARKIHIVFAQLIEAFILTLVAFAVAFIIAELMLPSFNRLADTQLELTILLQPGTLLALGFLLILTAIGSGTLPAMILSETRPLAVLQGRFAPTNRGATVQKALVFGQFVISLFLVLSTITVYRQLEHMRSGAIGFDSEHKLILPIKTNLETLRRNPEAIKQAFLEKPGIQAATVSSGVPGQLNGGYYLRKSGEDEAEPHWHNVLTVDYDFLDVMDISMIAGRAFRKNSEHDREHAFLLNEAALAELGFSTPEEALGQQFWAHYHGKTKEIIGVVRDFHYEGMQHQVEPMLLDIESSLYSTITLSLDNHDLVNTMQTVKETWDEVFPDVPFEYQFLNDIVDKQYRYELQASKLLATVTGLGLLVSCLGLFGLTAFVLQCRQREISIRRVMGANLTQIIQLLSGRFILLIILASCVAVPLVWWVSERWLSHYAYRVDTSWPISLEILSVFILIVVGVVSLQAYRTTQQNPADTLRQE